VPDIPDRVKMMQALDDFVEAAYAKAAKGGGAANFLQEFGEAA